MQEWFDAARNDDVQTITTLCPQLATQRDEHNNTALMLAAYRSSKQAISFLRHYELGMRDNMGRTALMNALVVAMNGDLDCAKLLIGELGLKDGEGKTALFLFCECQGIQINMLLEEANVGADALIPMLQNLLDFKPNWMQDYNMEAYQKATFKQNERDELIRQCVELL